MNPDAKVIALVVDEPDSPVDADAPDSTGAHRLIREADGSVTLEPVETVEEFDRIAKDTGCFRRGLPIRDPKTDEIIGYEMEEISPALTVVSG